MIAIDCFIHRLHLIGGYLPIEISKCCSELRPASQCSLTH